MSQFSSGRRRHRRDWRVAGAAVAAVAVVGGVAAVAPHLTVHGATERVQQAAATLYNGSVSNNGQGATVYNYPGSGTLDTNLAELGTLPEGAQVLVQCYWTGTAVQGPNATTSQGTDVFWDQITGASTGLPGNVSPGDTIVVPDAWIDTSPKTVDQLAPACNPGSGSPAPGSGSPPASNSGSVPASPPAPGNGSPGGGSGSGAPVVPGMPGGVPTADGTGPCTDIEVVFARGSGENASEFGGLGFPGGYVPTNRNDPSGVGLVPALQREPQLAGKTLSFYAVPWNSDWTQLHTLEGVDAMESWLTKEAARCPNTQFVLGGYSQGATVVDVTLGLGPAAGGAYILLTGRLAPVLGVAPIVGATAAVLFATKPGVSASLAGRIAAVVTFGNPLDYAHPDYATVSPLYGPKWKDFCNTGDPVCDNGINFSAHQQYHINGMTQSAADYAASMLNVAG
jgi:cutinase